MAIWKASGIKVDHNQTHGNRLAGVWVSGTGTQADVAHNKFRANDVSLDGGGPVRPPAPWAMTVTAHQNDFEDNLVALHAQPTLLPVDATKNWWGSPAGPGGDGPGDGDPINEEARAPKCSSNRGLRNGPTVESRSGKRPRRPVSPHPPARP